MPRTNAEQSWSMGCKAPTNVDDDPGRSALRAEVIVDGLLRQLTNAYDELRGEVASLREENIILRRSLRAARLNEHANEVSSYHQGAAGVGCPPRIPISGGGASSNAAEHGRAPSDDAMSFAARSQTPRPPSRQAQQGEGLQGLHHMHATHPISPVWEQIVTPRRTRLDASMDVTATTEYVLPIETAGDCWSKIISYPSSPFRLAWDMVGFVLIFYDLVMIPLRVFSPPETTFTTTIDYIVLLFWTLNVAASLQVGYVSKGVTIMKPYKIAIHYLKGWFILDCLVLIPDWYFTIIDLQGPEAANGGVDPGAGNIIKLLRILRLTKCLRLLRAARLKKIFQTITDRIDSEYTGIVLNILKMIVLLLVVNHFIASFWYLVGLSDSDSSWVSTYIQDHEEWFRRYALSFHWSITQFTPASKTPVQPVNLKERFFAVCVVIFALVGFSYIVGSITGSLTQLRAIAEDADKQFYQVRRYLRQNDVSLALGARLQRFLEHAYAKSKKRTDGANIPIFNLLTESLRRELRLEVALPHLKEHPLFLHLSREYMPTLQRIAVACMSTQCLAHGDHLFFPGEGATHMLFVESGVLKYHPIPSSDTVQCEPNVVRKRDAWIAEPCLWTTSWIHVGRMTALAEAEVLLIKPSEFAQKVTVSPGTFHVVAKYARHFVEWLNSEASAASDIYLVEDVFARFAQWLPFDEADIEQVTRLHRKSRTLFKSATEDALCGTATSP